MRDKLREYVEELFKDAPKTKQIVEIKEEILQNTTDRYDDLIREGKTPEAAFNIAVAGIGDISELIGSVCGPSGEGTAPGQPLYTKEEIRKDNERSGILLAISVMLYILSVIPIILLSGSKYEDTLGVCIMFIMVAAATGIIIYRSKTKLHYTKTEDTVVENFKEWNHEKDERKALRKSIETALWCITLVLYFVISFSTGKWYITWLIFVVAGAVENIIRACFDIKK
ncbi:MAG: permease prefix domain 1-containing protein [Clostridia bacterium]